MGKQCIARVEASVEEHGGDAGFGFAVGDGPLDGGGSAVLGKERAVDVNVAEAREVEHPLGDDAAVSDYDDGVRGNLFKKSTKFGVGFESLGLEDGKTEGEGELLDRRDVKLELAAGRAVGLREDERNFVARVDDGLEAGDSEFWGSAEDEFHEFPRCGSLPVAMLLELLDAAEDEVALEAAEAVNEEDAVEVVDLMEHGAGQQFRTFYFKYFPFDVLRTDFNPCITLDFLVDIRKAEAAFLFELLTAAIDDLGVDKDELIFRSLFKAYVYHCDLLGDAYLRSSKADTLGGVHAVEHLFDELSQFRGEFGDWLTLFQQDGVGVFDDRVELGGGLADGVAGHLAGYASFGGCIEFGFGGHDSEGFDLGTVALVVALEFEEAIAAEFFQNRAGDGEGDHGLGGDTGGGDDADVGALIGCFGGLAGCEGDRGEGATKGRDGLEVAADDEVLAVGHAAFETAGVVVLAGESGERAGVPFGVGDGVVDLRAGGLGCRDAAAEFDGFDGLKAHDGLGQEAVEALIPVDVGADAGGKAVDDDLKDAADGVTGAEGGVDFSLHTGFGFGVDAGEEDVFSAGEGGDLGEGGLAGELGCADAGNVAGNLDAEGAQEHLGDGSAGYAGGGLAGGGALEDIAGVGEVVLEGAGEVCMAGAWGRYRLMLVRIAFGHGKDLFPVLPVLVGQGHGDGRADGVAMADAGENVGGVALDAHAAAATVALLATPELVVEEGLVYGDARG